MKGGSVTGIVKFPLVTPLSCLLASIHFVGITLNSILKKKKRKFTFNNDKIKINKNSNVENITKNRSI